jgi:tetratricopeptide (TPR) repeat protein
MKLKTSIYTLIVLLIISCSNSSNSEKFIKKVTGRYLYNSDEIITVYFNDHTLFLKWRGATAIKPLKIDDNTFFVKEMNEKIQFLNNPTNGKTYLVLVPKENEPLQYNFKKLAPTEKIPSEYLANNEFDKALEAYITIQKNDSLDPTIEEHNFNRLGYQKLKNKNYEEALQIFKLNMELYPSSSNVYDSYADALKRSGDTIKALEFYKKSIALDSGNKIAKRFIEKYDKK